jgi:hypothetical protein
MIRAGRSHQTQRARRDGRAERYRSHCKTPCHAEHTRQHRVGDGPLQERKSRNVDDAVRSADRGE